MEVSILRGRQKQPGSLTANGSRKEPQQPVAKVIDVSIDAVVEIYWASR